MSDERKPRRNTKKPEVKPPLDPEAAAWWRGLIKPIVIEMQRRGIKDIEIHKDGTHVRFVLTPS
jgi:hypothetical protein